MGTVPISRRFIIYNNRNSAFNYFYKSLKSSIKDFARVENMVGVKNIFDVFHQPNFFLS